MAFKIRRPYQSRERYEAAEKTYFAHLAQFDSRADTDLFKYFGWDSFHDGLITSIKFNRDLGVVEFVIGCPNIRIPDPKLGYSNAPAVEFICRFSGVVQFSVGNESHLDGKTRRIAIPRYLYSEINTGVSRRHLKVNPGLSSLRILALGANKQIWIELTFTSLSVRPKDPVALSKFLGTSGVEFNLYSPHA